MTEVAIGTQPWIGYGPFWIADDQGFDTDHGVDIKLVNFSTDQDLESGFASGKFQAANNANNTLIRLADLGLDYKIALMEDVSLEADAVVSCNPDIESIEDIEGAKVAFEEFSVSDVLFNYALNEAGVDIDSIDYVPLPAADAGTAAVAGRVDVAVTYEPYLQAAVKEGDNCKIIYTAGENPGLISDALAINSEFAESESGGGRRRPAGVGRRGRLLQREHRGGPGDHRRERRREAGGADGELQGRPAVRPAGVAGLPRKRLRDALERHQDDHVRPGSDRDRARGDRLPRYLVRRAGARGRRVGRMAGAADQTAAGAPRGAPAAARPHKRKKRKRKLFRLYSPIEPRTYMVIAILSFGALIGGWWLAAELDLAKDIFLPTPVDVWNSGVEAAKDGTLWDDA